MKTLQVLEKHPNFDIRPFLIDIMILDLWVLDTARRSFKRVPKILSTMLKIFIVMGIGAGLFSYYILSGLKLEITTLEGVSLEIEASEKHGLIGIADASARSQSEPGFEREINQLKNKALSLEIALRRMNSQMRSISRDHMRDRCKEDDLADFASEAAGGSVLDVPNTQSYFEPKDKQITLFGIPICKPSYYTPRKVIQPWTQAGECWAFRGDRGNVKIALAYAAMIDQVTLEHIPVSASLTGKIDSAPRDFRVTALFPEGSITVGTFVYNQYGPSSQTFQVTDERFKDIPIKIVALEILSNWGNPDYTCIYRFKVHGKISP